MYLVEFPVLLIRRSLLIGTKWLNGTYKGWFNYARISVWNERLTKSNDRSWITLNIISQARACVLNWKGRSYYICNCHTYADDDNAAARWVSMAFRSSASFRPPPKKRWRIELIFPVSIYYSSICCWWWCGELEISSRQTDRDDILTARVSFQVAVSLVNIISSTSLEWLWWMPPASFLTRTNAH